MSGPQPNSVANKLKRKSSRAWRTLKNRSAASAQIAAQRLFDQHLCIGITGFSRAGKSTFITSLIYQLLHHEQAALAAFSPVIRGELLSVKVLNQPRTLVPQFDYQAGIDALNGQPARWPAPTHGLSSTLLELRYRRRKTLLNRQSVGTVRIELRDYPGEWLLDLPMLRLSYEQWSQEQLAAFALPVRQTLQQGLAQQLSAIDPFSPFDPEQCQTLFSDYQAYLQRCKQAHLVILQPGRALTPAAQQAATWQPFLPLPSLTSPLGDQQRYPPGSWAEQMQQRYQHYCDQLVMPFYRATFADIERQLVLVDVLGALSHGEAALADTQAGLSMVMESFQLGRNSWLSHLFKPKVEQLLIAASKIDQVLPDQHEQVRILLSRIAANAYRNARHEGIDLFCEAFASVRATSIREYQGQPMLQGRYNQGEAGLHGHPQIPEHLPEGDEWQAFAGWQLPQLLPPDGLQLHRGGPLPHIRLDSLLRELFGDQFQ